ncbi:helix-hairpin-helix domain-containing protein [Arthrobacter sp. H14-L1]|uniref:helix-hairpin-helix domain-containing protein n=1 Tax=Arthrobacter sp. H14-L1 TaxID=2996697 RepID=UPI00226D966C|nr:helix-hairpin-helix domain-containing protein [Arthrobacter sp. H14-L1]
MVRQAKHSCAADGGAGHRLSGLLLPLAEPTSTDVPANSEIAAAEPAVVSSWPAGRLRWRVGSNAVLIILAVLASAVLVLVLHAMGQQLANDNVAAAPSVQVRVPSNGQTGATADGASASAPGAPLAGSQTQGAMPNPAYPGQTNLTGGNTGSAVLVHVAGAVVHPGVVMLPSGSRVYQAIAAVGGELPEAAVDAVNLAAVLQDGEQLFIRTKDQAAAAPGLGAQGGAPDTPGAPHGGAVVGSAAAGLVNLNSAGLQELMTLPKVGPVLGQRILDFRRQHGKFASAQELDAVDGIGPKLLATLLPLLTV